MPDDSYIKDKSIDQLLIELYGTAQVGSRVHEQQKMAIVARCAQLVADRFQDVAEATRMAAEVNRASNESNQQLGEIMVRLNRRLNLATWLGAIAAAVAAAVAVFALLR
jgi:predicted lysophospholipase L1 biosynthesis ABC-type transport system permease subunit